jgi:TonB family protein
LLQASGDYPYFCFFIYKVYLVLVAVVGAPAAPVSGRIYDPAGAVIPGVKVILTDQQSQGQQTLSTSETGNYKFESVAPGSYTLEVLAPGFAYSRRGNITLDPSSNYIANFVLRIGEIQETLEVKATGTPKPQATPQRIRVGGNMQATKLLKQPRVAYPEKAKAEGREGTVMLRAVIGKDGTVGELVTTTDSDPELAAAAIDAVRRWQYQPTMLNGQAVEVITTVQVNFKLTQ